MPRCACSRSWGSTWMPRTAMRTWGTTWRSVWTRRSPPTTASPPEAPGFGSPQAAPRVRSRLRFDRSIPDRPGLPLGLLLGGRFRDPLGAGPGRALGGGDFGRLGGPALVVGLLDPALELTAEPLQDGL